MAPYNDSPPGQADGAKQSEYSPLASSNDFAEDEKLLHPGRIAHPASKWTKTWKIIRLILEIIGLLLLVLNSLMLLNYSRAVTGPDPRISSGPANHHKQYGSDPRYMSFDHKYDYLWKEAFTEEWGLVALPPFKDAAGLYSRDPTHDEGGIGIFHAFHCLASMRTAFQKMNESKVTLEQLQKGDHVAHCFDYMRNAIFCMADGKALPVAEDCWPLTTTATQILSNSLETSRATHGVQSLKANGTCVLAVITRGSNR